MYLLQGESMKTLVLQTKPDSVLEGEEHFTLTLISADNGALISPTLGVATVAILADQAASGQISVAPESSVVVIGRPQGSYDGSGEVKLLRTIGVYGTVQVVWQILSPNSDLFLVTSGTVTFEDMQSTASFFVQVSS